MAASFRSRLIDVPARLDRAAHVNIGFHVRRDRGGTDLADGSILDGAPSAELSALLESIADISYDVQPKFTPMTCQALVRLIVGRAYAPALLELCHLVRVAALAPRRKFELFFWGVNVARAGAYAGWVRAQLKTRAGAPAQPAIELEQGGVAVIYTDGRFSISYGRMPLLVALMEFLISSIGYDALRERIEALLAGPASLASAGSMANDLSRAVYAWLAPHLPSAHENRQLDTLVSWLAARQSRITDTAGQSFTADDVDDDAVLDFWLEADEGEFRTYESALRGFLLLIEAMEHAAAVTGVARAASLGTDAEAGEVEPVAPDADGWADALGGRSNRVITAEDVDPGADPLAALAEPPADAVKALNSRERDELDMILDAGPRGERLMLSLLRRAVFGAVQRRISEALRRGGRPAAARVLVELIRDGDAAPVKDAGPASYVAWAERSDALAAHVERVMLASLHVLAKAEKAEAIYLLRGVGRTLDLKTLLVDGESVDVARLGERLTDATLVGPEIAALMLRARRSFQGLSRAGFEADAPAKAAVVAGHAAAAPHLPRLAARLDRARNALGRRTAENWAAQQEADRHLFARRFAVIYGIVSGEASS